MGRPPDRPLPPYMTGAAAPKLEDPYDDEPTPDEGVAPAARSETPSPAPSKRRPVPAPLTVAPKGSLNAYDPLTLATATESYRDRAPVPVAAEPEHAGPEDGPAQTEPVLEPEPIPAEITPEQTTGKSGPAAVEFQATSVTADPKRVSRVPAPPTGAPVASPRVTPPNEIRERIRDTAPDGGRLRASHASAIPTRQRPAARPTSATPTRAEDLDEGYQQPRTFRVPMPGGKRRVGVANERGSLIRLRWATLGASVLTLALASGVVGFTVSQNMNEARGAVLTKTDADRLHLSEVNTPALTAAAEEYLRSCLTRYVNRNGSTPPAEANRLDTIKTMSLKGSDPMCTSQPGSGKPVARTVTSITPSGFPEALPGLTGAFAVPFLVTTSDGITSTMTVPTWLNDPAAGTGARIVGPIGITPVPVTADPKANSSEARTPDAALSQEMQSAFLPSLFTAWTASSPDLAQFLAPSASTAARTGLGGKYVLTQVSSAAAYPDVPPPAGEKPVYGEGATATVDVRLAMNDQSGHATTSGVRVDIVRRSDKWFLVDVRGGTLGEIPTAFN